MAQEVSAETIASRRMGTTTRDTNERDDPAQTVKVSRS